jgi:CDK inhibitor PHO81
LLAVGIRPSPTRIESTSLNPLDASSPTATPTLGPGRSTSSTTLTSSTPFLLSPALHAQNPSLGNHLNLDAGVQSIDLEPLPPGAEPPAPGESASGGVNGVARGRDRERDESFKAHRAVFFFKLGRELEKVSDVEQIWACLVESVGLTQDMRYVQINAFYLTKERDLRLRILTLLNNRKRLLLHLGSASSSDPSDLDDVAQGMSGADSSRKGAEWANLEEGWRLFERDLVKLQQFIEINATGFRKILKKWDKRSKSSTKELYLERQVEIQPCFNREVRCDD